MKGTLLFLSLWVWDSPSISDDKSLTPGRLAHFAASQYITDPKWECHLPMCSMSICIPLRLSTVLVHAAQDVMFLWTMGRLTAAEIKIVSASKNVDSRSR